MSKNQLWTEVQDHAWHGRWNEARESARLIPCDSCQSLALQFIEAHELASAKISGCDPYDALRAVVGEAIISREMYDQEMRKRVALGE